MLTLTIFPRLVYRDRATAIHLLLFLIADCLLISLAFALNVPTHLLNFILMYDVLTIIAEFLYIVVSIAVGIILSFVVISKIQDWKKKKE